jgi:cardiolipin synthase (CMP-forming)
MDIAKPSDPSDTVGSEALEESNEAERVYQHAYVTVPNVICALRLVGAIWLFWLASHGSLRLFTAVFVVLNLSDWIDGRLARWLKQRSDFGARLDSFADSVLYGALFFGFFWFRSDVMIREAGWWIVGLLSYLLTTGAGLWKYGRVPSYHTYGAKISQWFVLAGTICLLLDYTIWPFRIALLLVTLTNLEAAAITWLLPKWRADVLTIFHVLKPNHGQSP